MSATRLTDFNQNSAGFLWMNKRYAVPMSAASGCLINHLDTFVQKFFYSGVNIVNLKCQMMDSGAFFFQEFPNGAFRVRTFKVFQSTLANGIKGRANLLIRNFFYMVMFDAE